MYYQIFIANFFFNHILEQQQWLQLDKYPKLFKKSWLEKFLS